jgi:hypothetical protein
MLQSETKKAKYSAPAVQSTSGVPHREVQITSLHVCDTKAVLKQGTVEVHLCSGDNYIWMRHTISGDTGKEFLELLSLELREKM